MPSRLTVPVDSVSAGPAPMLTDITMPSVMPPSFPAAVPPPTQQGRQQQQDQRTGAAKTSATKAPASIIRNSSNRVRDTSATRGGRVTFARDDDHQHCRRDDNDNDGRTSTTGTSRERTGRTSSGAYRSDRYRTSSSSDKRQHQHQQQRRKTTTTARKTPGSERSIRSSSTGTTTSSSSSSAKKNESVARNRLESALRDQFDSSLTGSQGLSTLIGRKDAADICSRKSSKDKEKDNDNDSGKRDSGNVRERENVAPDILAGSNSSSRRSSSRSRVPGPNERLYKDRYGKSIDDAIRKHARDNPAKPLRDYKSMSQNEKVQELDKVGSLLARLGICDDFCASQVSSSDQHSSQAWNTSDSTQQQHQVGADAGNTARPSGVDESRTTMGSFGHRSNTSRASGRDVDESSSTMSGSSHLSRRGSANGRDGIDESRTTLGADGNGSSNTNQSRQRHLSNVDVDESRTTLGSDRSHREMVSEGQSAAMGTDRRQNNSDTVDDSRTTMDLGCANDTTACSPTRLDQSSVVFDFGSGSGGGGGGGTIVTTPKQDMPSHRRAINDHEDNNNSDMVDSPPEEERMQEQGITRLEESHFTCNADAGTVAETQGGRSAAQPKFLFHTQTPQFDRAGSNSFDQSPFHTDQKSVHASRSNDTTTQSAVLLSNRQKDIFSGTSSPSNHDDESYSSVEMPRSTVKDMHHSGGRGDDVPRCNTSNQPQLFQSPISSRFSSNRKRLATTSGKRGADMQRSRLDRENIQDDTDDEMIGHIDDDSFETDCPSEQIESPSQLLCSSIKSPPSEFEAATPPFLAAASQSPILHCSDSVMDAEQSTEFGSQKSPAFSQRRDKISSSSHVGKHQSSQYNARRERSPVDSQMTPVFSYQQSPMSVGGSRSPSRDMANMSIDDDERFRDEIVAGGGGGVTRQVRIRGTRRSLMNDTVESVNCTVLPRRDRTRKERGREYSRDVAPADIHMKNGEAYRLDPLRVRRPVGKNDRPRRRASSVDTPMRDGRGGKSISRSRRGISRSPPTISFPDPLSSFDRRTAERLEVVSDWVMNEEEDGGGDRKGKQGEDSVDWFSDDDSEGKNDRNGKGIVISMTMPHIVGVTLKLIVTNGAKPKSRKRSASPFGSQSQVSTTALNGGTLIVLRSKEDLEEWEGTLRERTCYSVLNHAAISSSERKRSKTAGKCAGFQIVITTYDALKCRESSFALDELGRAVVHEESSQGGWMASRSQSRPLSCEHLSVLHQLIWHRVIFMDVLGRQSYTAKPTTARYKSSVALNSKSRFIFFEKETGSTTYHLEDSFKESRKQLCAVAATLHIPEDEAEELIVGHAMVDFRDVKEDEGQLDADGSRYEEDESRYRDGQGYNLDDDDSYSRCHSDSEIMMSPIRRR
mmetsp:Transcript_7379/g.16104  ORF Transcript_7379/g.16104 Transcript_7379/m.16104 type:complete len:1382 (-) Transcript_7379:151-4296(-)